MRKRTVAFDLGDVRIGVAVSDPTGTIASPHSFMAASRGAEGAAEIADELGAGEIVVGMPYSMDGTIGPQGRKVEAFVEELRGRTTLPVLIWDERLSSREAERRMTEGGLSRSRRRKGRKRRDRRGGGRGSGGPNRDAVAASIILEGYLSSR